MIERRQEPRISTFDLGRIIFGDQLKSVECIVRDISEGGACLQVESTQGIPEDLFVKIPVKKMQRLCRVAWRSRDRVGVSFRSYDRRKIGSTAAA